MGGTLDPETTPGGGLTMVLRLPAVDDAAADGEGVLAAELPAFARGNGGHGRPTPGAERI